MCSHISMDLSAVMPSETFVVVFIGEEGLILL